MLDFTPVLVGRFAHAQRTRWEPPACAIGLSISGLRRWRVRGHDLTEPGPMLSINCPGLWSEFEYGPDRENWVMMGHTPHVRPGTVAGTLELDVTGTWVAVPALVRLATEQVPAWQEEFLRLYDAFRDPVPAAALRLRLGFAALLRAFLDHGLPPVASPAARLKRLIEDDRACSEGLGRLSRRCGGDPDHLRERFVAAYGLTPMAYRHRRRLATAMDLIAVTGLPIGEIGRRIGFEHVSHFSGFLRRHAGMSPREALARYRHR